MGTVDIRGYGQYQAHRFELVAEDEERYAVYGSDGQDLVDPTPETQLYELICDILTRRGDFCCIRPASSGGPRARGRRCWLGTAGSCRAGAGRRLHGVSQPGS